MTTRLYLVLDDPAPLAGTAFPEAATDWARLARAGFRHLVRLEPGTLDPSPLVPDELRLEDLVGGRRPREPERERERVLAAARSAADAVTGGEGVLFHCRGGTGRTGTVLACMLRLLGRSAGEAVAAVQAHRPHWPESPWQEDVVRAMP